MTKPMTYDEICKFALKIQEDNKSIGLKLGGKNFDEVDIESQDQFQNILQQGNVVLQLFLSKTDEEMVDILETTQEILVDNSGDEKLYGAVSIFRTICQMQLQWRGTEEYKKVSSMIKNSDIFKGVGER